MNTDQLAAEAWHKSAIEKATEEGQEIGSMLMAEAVVKAFTEGGRFGFTDENDPRYKLNQILDFRAAHASRDVEAEIRQAIKAFVPADENIDERGTLDALNVLFQRIKQGTWPSDRAAHASELPRPFAKPIKEGDPVIDYKGLRSGNPDPDDFTPTGHCLGTAHASEKTTDVPMAVRLAIRVLLNHIDEPVAWNNCKKTVEHWLDSLPQRPTPATDDTKRLDWLHDAAMRMPNDASLDVILNQHGWTSLREAIDAAMSQTKEGK